MADRLRDTVMAELQGAANREAIQIGMNRVRADAHLLQYFKEYGMPTARLKELSQAADRTREP